MQRKRSPGGPQPFASGAMGAARSSTRVAGPRRADGTPAYLRAGAAATAPVADAPTIANPPALAGALPLAGGGSGRADGAVAARGVAGAGARLPHYLQLQRAFGAHDLSAVRAHGDGGAAAACDDLGARAYARGDDVAFAEAAPDLHTAAHEATHVVQQRAGLRPPGGVGRRGDRFERQADAVADAVVAGRAASPLLAGLGASRASAATASVMKLDDDSAAQASPAEAAPAATATGERLYYVPFNDDGSWDAARLLAQLDARAAQAPADAGKSGGDAVVRAAITAGSRATFELARDMLKAAIAAEQATPGEADAASAHPQLFRIAFDLESGLRYGSHEGGPTTLTFDDFATLARWVPRFAPAMPGTATPAAAAETPAASAPAPTDPVAKIRPDPAAITAAPAQSSGVAAQTPTVLYDAKGSAIARLDAGTRLDVSGLPTEAGEGRTAGAYYQVSYYGHMGGGGVDSRVAAYVAVAALRLGESAPRPPEQTGNDWISVVPEAGARAGDPDAVSAAASAIAAERAAIERRKLQHVDKDGASKPRDGYQSGSDAATKSYLEWLDQPDTKPQLARGTDDIRWRAFRLLFKGEGNPATVMTYDATNITWGVGFAGAGDGGVALTEQMMARLFNQSGESRAAFWRAGVGVGATRRAAPGGKTVAGTELIAVSVPKNPAAATLLRGTRAENYVRDQPALLSLMMNTTMGLQKAGAATPDAVVRQQNLDAQFETFLANTLAGSDGIIERMRDDPRAAAIAAHAVHSGNHSWGIFAGASDLGAVEAAIRANIEVLKTRNQKVRDDNAAEPDPAKHKKVMYIVPLAQLEANIK